MKYRVAILLLLAIFLGLLNWWFTRPAFNVSLDETVFNAMSVAPIDQAVTLARTDAGSIVLVVDVDPEGFRAVDLNAAMGETYSDAIDAYSAISLQALHDLFATGAQLKYTWSDLGLPLRPSYPNIAAGTNFRAHAQEVGLDETPFLFPKLSAPTPWNSDVLAGGRLDFEVELCAVPLSDYRVGIPAGLGYLLCGDYTDRWTLVRELDLDGVMGQTGFASAKGGESRLPVGPFLVVPANDNFYHDIEISLYLNDALRQQAMASEMVWSPQEILSNTLADCQSSYQVGDNTVSIADCNVIPAGTLVLTGTPGGVLFKLATLWNPLAYLREGDVVTSFGTYLGFMQNQISDTEDR